MAEKLYWTILEYSANLVEAIMMLIMLQQFFESKYKKKWPYLISTIIVFGMITVLNGFSASMLVTVLLFIGTGILIGFLLFDGSTISRILVPMLMTVLLVVAEVLTIGVLKLAFNSTDVQLANETTYRMLGIIVSKVLLIVLVRIAGRFSKKEYTKIPLVYNLCLLIIPFVTITCMVSILQYMMFSVKSVLNPLWIAISAVGLLFINLLVIYLFEALMNYSKNQSRYELMIQQANMLSNHLRETNALQEETHRIWHDMKNHFTVIQWMVKSQSYDKLDQYMLTLNESVMNSMLNIQSGNALLDALLNPKAAEAKKYGIEMTVNACVPSNISIEDIDLNIVFSNALDNAMDACKKMPEGRERFINIDTYIKNDHLMVLMKNSFNGVIKITGDEFRTTKTEIGRHGIGMGNIKRVINKYDGHIMTNTEDNVFILSIIMYCNIINEKAI